MNLTDRDNDSPKEHNHAFPDLLMAINKGVSDETI